jgi:hypothetical protein
MAMVDGHGNLNYNVGQSDFPPYLSTSRHNFRLSRRVYLSLIFHLPNMNT